MYSKIVPGIYKNSAKKTSFCTYTKKFQGKCMYSKIVPRKLYMHKIVLRKLHKIMPRKLYVHKIVPKNSNMYVHKSSAERSPILRTQK